ncbi:hypothetical protein NDU88_007943 [Pleurodeles waltl]|uniref:Uncharacterized protein n=1 Tax=Pleurodeles waltl TaxID=8319 RepID=A0AAV7P292_PLEWA|nr:hypothetical protein NDU88_007943 [Pleurodeles waltl]
MSRGTYGYSHRNTFRGPKCPGCHPSLQGLRRVPPHTSQLGRLIPKPAATQAPQARQHDKPPGPQAQPSSEPRN